MNTNNSNLKIKYKSEHKNDSSMNLDLEDSYNSKNEEKLYKNHKNYYQKLKDDQ